MRLRFLFSKTGNPTLSTKKSRKKREALWNSSPNTGYWTNTCAHDSTYKTGLWMLRAEGLSSPLHRLLLMKFHMGCVSEWVTGGGTDAAARWQRQKPDGGRGGFTPLSRSRVCKSRHTHVQVSESCLRVSSRAPGGDLKDLPEQVSDPLSSSQPGARRGSKKWEMNGNLSVRRYPSRCLWFLFVVS